MNYEEFNTILKKQVYALPYEKQLELAITICEKMFFDYQKFFEIHKWGDPDLLMDGINICQQSMKNPIDIKQIEKILLKIDLITPDTEDFGDEIGSYALNAATAVSDALEFLIDKDQSRILNVVSYYTDTVDFKIQENKVLTDDEKNKHPLMIEARAFLINKTK